MRVSCCTYVCAPHSFLAHWGQKRVPDCPGTLVTGDCEPTGAGNRTQVLCESRRPWPLSHLSGPSCILLSPDCFCGICAVWMWAPVNACGQRLMFMSLFIALHLNFWDSIILLPWSLSTLLGCLASQWTPVSAFPALGLCIHKSLLGLYMDVGELTSVLLLAQQAPYWLGHHPAPSAGRPLHCLQIMALWLILI